VTASSLTALQAKVKEMRELLVRAHRSMSTVFTTSQTLDDITAFLAKEK